MDNIIWMSCNKIALLSTILFFLNLCSPRDPLGLTEVSFLEDGVVLSKNIKVTVDENYFLMLDAHGSVEDKEKVDSFIGVGSVSVKCKSYDDLDLLYKQHKEVSGIPTKLKITIFDRNNKKFVINKEFDSACFYSHGFKEYSSQREIAGFYLARGDYDVEIYNMRAIPEINGVQTEFYFRVGSAVF